MYGNLVLRFTDSGSRVIETAHVAQLVEHVLGKDEVTRSIRVVGSIPSFAWAAPSIKWARISTVPSGI